MDIKLIVISAAWIPFDRFWIDPPKNESLSEYVSPFVAAIAAWQGRGYTAQADVTADRMYSVIDMGVYYNFMPLAGRLALVDPVPQIHRPVQGQPRELR